MPGIGPEGLIQHQKHQLDKNQHGNKTNEIADSPFAVTPEEVIENQVGSPLMGFESLKDNTSAIFVALPL